MSFHCVYRISDVSNGRYYYGYKSCDIDPELVVGITYFSSSSDSEFIEKQKNFPELFRYKIVFRSSDRESAMLREIRLHSMFDVGRNPRFYNKATQSSSGFISTLKGRTYDDIFGEERSREIKKMRSDQFKQSRDKQISSGVPNPMYGRKHKEESIQKMRERNKSPRRGSFWITNHKENRKIHGHYVIPYGWELGRKANTSQFINKKFLSED